MRRTSALTIAIALVAVPAWAKPTVVIPFELGATAPLGATSGIIVDGELEIPTLGAISAGFCARPCVVDGDCGGGQTCNLNRGYCVALSGTTCDEDDDCAGTENCELPFEIVNDTNPWSHFQADMAVEQGRSATMPVNFTATPRSLDCADVTLLGRCTNNTTVPCASNADCAGGACGMGLGEVPIIITESSGGVRQCVITVGCDNNATYCPPAAFGGGPQHFTRRTLRVHFNDEDQFECEESFTDGTHCTKCAGNDDSCAPSGGQCPAEVGGVPKCSKATYSKLTLTIGQRRKVCVETRNFLGLGGYNVQCTLYADNPTSLPNKGAVEIGGGQRPQGSCTGGTEAGTACSINGDCDGGGTCTNPSSVIANVARSRWGVADSSKAAQDMFIRFDNIEHYDLNATPGDLQKALDRRWLVSDLVAAAGINSCEATGCTDHGACVDDTSGGVGRADGQTTRLVCALNEEERVTHSPWPSPSPVAGTLESDAWVAVSAAYRENSTTDANKTVSYGIADGGSAQSISFNVNNTAEDDYAGLPTAIFDVAPGGGSWTTSNFGTMDWGVKQTGDSGNSGKVAFTSGFVAVTYTLPSVVKAVTFPDVDGNGRRTVCFMNDSRWNGDDIGTRLVERLADIAVDDIIGQAAGGRKCADFAAQTTAIADGTSSYRKAYKGSVNQDCDVLFADCAANDWVEEFPRAGRCYQPWCSESSLAACTIDANCSGGEKCRLGQCIKPCAIDSECSGTCGGPNNDGACNLPDGTNWLRQEAPTAALCVDGDKFATKGFNAGTACGSATDCSYCSNNKSLPCGESCTSGGGSCIASSSAGPCDNEGSTSGWCEVLDYYASPGCPGGICLQRTSQSYVRNVFRTMVQTWDARTGGKDVRVVISPTYAPHEDFGAGWSCQYNEFRTFGAWERELAIEMGLAWADQEKWFQERSPTGDADYYPASDFLGIHLSSSEGQPTLADMFATCLRAEHDPAIDCRPILIPCTNDASCTSAGATGTTCKDWPGGGAQKYCQI
jgi:hypothetical protein